MYHAATPGKIRPGWPWAVSVQQLRDPFDFLAAEGYAAPTMSELVTEPQNGPDAPPSSLSAMVKLGNLACMRGTAKARRAGATWFVVTGSIGHKPGWADERRPGGRLLDASELRAMQEAGMEFGSHTASHTRLTKLDDERMQQEPKVSINPGGFAGASGKQLCLEWAWRHCCAYSPLPRRMHTQTGWAVRENNPFRLRRLSGFNEDTGSLFARKLAFARYDLRWAELAGYWRRRLAAKLTGQP